MLKKMSIRLRLTILSILLLALCCISLTTVLNVSATRMANEIEAIAVLPAQNIKPGETPTIAVPSLPITPTIRGEISSDARNEFFHSSIFFALCILSIGGGLTYYISGRTLKPLKNLNEQMRNRTVHNLSEALPVPQNNDEIATLTHSFNEMSEKLEEAFAMQRRFSQSAAHELRTPLTVLKTKVDVFRKRKEHTPEEYDKLISTITIHTNRLSDLVKDLLDLTNMDALDCDEPIYIKSMLAEVSDELSPLADDKKITLILEGEEQSIQGNNSLLHRAFYNLLENAIKYNVEGGKVLVFVSKNNDKCEVTIADTGIGIEPNLRELIFEPFYRIDKSRSRQMGGAGLGLSTVRVIVEKHGGTVTVSENSDEGSIFSIIL